MPSASSGRKSVPMPSARSARFDLCVTTAGVKQSTRPAWLWSAATPHVRGGTSCAHPPARCRWLVGAGVPPTTPTCQTPQHGRSAGRRQCRRPPQTWPAAAPGHPTYGGATGATDARPRRPSGNIHHSGALSFPQGRFTRPKGRCVDGSRRSCPLSRRRASRWHPQPRQPRSPAGRPPRLFVASRSLSKSQ